MRLVGIMALLRSPRGCPWDRQQTHRSLRPYLLEEAYEAIEAIERGDDLALRDELGDVLLQVVFHAELAAGDGRFAIGDVIDALAEKLIRRHPHVFRPDGTPLSPREYLARSAATPKAVTTQWQRIKAREKPTRRRQAPSVLDGVPRALPSLLRAHRLGGRAAGVAFDWPDVAGVMDKVEEEWRELRDALGEGRARTAEELGDLLFSIANLARKLEIDPESALREANDKFSRRFAALERHLARAGSSVHDATPDEMEAAWNAVKRSAREKRTRASGGPSRSTRRPRGRRSR